MKRILAAVLLLTLTSSAMATDLNRIPFPIFGNANTGIQLIGPLGSKVTKLTVNNAAVNLTNYIMFEVVIPAALTTCQLRLSATLPSGNYGTNQAVIFPASVLVQHSVNPGTTFANLSGCTNAYIEIQ